MAHPVVNRLRGRGTPREDILDRLHRTNPSYRVNWVPEGEIHQDHTGEKYQRPGLWRIYEYKPDPLRRSAALARLQRFERWPEEKRAKNRGLIWDIEDSVDGLHMVAEFTNEQFGTDKMFEILQEGERELMAFKEDVAKAQAQQAENEILAEMNDNAEYAELVRETAKDFYNRVKGNAVVGWTPSKETV